MKMRSATRRKVLSLLFVNAAAAHLSDHAIAQPVSGAMKDIRYVVFHRPGPAWQQGKGMFEQPGVMQHVQHYRQWLTAGKLELGGPHLDAGGGGMMIPVAGVSEEDVKRFALEDPAVNDGTLLVEVRPWLVGMSK
ncbi:hypothetical protein AACH06_29995 [Ideonella sp. DXS29W]|uniref:YCII-related domain-containing protein n=1 Tax=Ideonella lacteola TaxID=2984193 RepID=A0ABU9C1Z1_9BURK